MRRALLLGLFFLSGCATAQRGPASADNEIDVGKWGTKEVFVQEDHYGSGMLGKMRVIRLMAHSSVIKFRVVMKTTNCNVNAFSAKTYELEKMRVDPTESSYDIAGRYYVEPSFGMYEMGCPKNQEERVLASDVLTLRGLAKSTVTKSDGTKVTFDSPRTLVDLVIPERYEIQILQ